MKCLLIHHFGGLGGGTNSCLDIASLLVKQGHEVTLSIPRPHDSIIEYCYNNGINIDIVTIPVPCFSFHNASGSFIRELLKYVRTKKYLSLWKNHIEELNPTLVMLNSMSQLPLGKYVGKRKCICFIRETKKQKWSFLGNYFIRTMMRNTFGLIFLTRYDQNDWNIRDFPNQYVLPDFVSTHLFKVPKVTVEIARQELGIALDSKLILYLGGLNYAKGSYDIVKAFTKLKESETNVQLLILGNKNDHVLRSKINMILRPSLYFDLKKTFRLIKNNNKDKEYIKLIGTVSDVNNWYYISDIVVFPVKRVHQARPIYEAGFYYKPIVLPDYDNFKENLKDNYNGLFYQKNNVESFAITLEKLKTSDILRMGQNNHKMYLSTHSEEYAYDCLKNILNKILR